jgi:hypothetical protein
VPRRASRVVRAIACALAALALGGCVLDRILETHRQLCDASPRQGVVAGGDGAPMRVTFDQPALTREDTEWLVGLPPTRVLASADGVRLVFAAARADRAQDGLEPLVTEQRFAPVDGAMMLVEIVPPARLSALVPRELVDRSIAAARKPELSLAPPGARFDIAALDASAFPDRPRLESILGPAQERESDGTLVYRFCLLPCDDRARPLARLAYRFGWDGRLEQGDFGYFRYRLLVDRPRGVATLTLRL